MQRVAVVGAGTMGHCLAMVFALGGYQVMLMDNDPQMLPKARGLIVSNLQTLAEAGEFDLARQQEISQQRIGYTTDLAQCVGEADFVVEAVVEKPAVKKEVFAELDRLAPPGAILASNTSYLDIFQFVETKRPEKVLITHWFAPPHIVPLVEIVPGPQTDPQVVAQVKKMHDELGKTTIVMKKFLPGFIGNRMQAALALEVYKLLDEGYATPEEVDRAAKAGFGLRLPILGVVKRVDFAGLDMAQLALHNRSYQPPEVRGRSDIIDKLVAQGRLGVKAGRGFYDYGDRTPAEIMRERDLKLLKLRKVLRELGEMD